jgi:hypothetical protein
MATRSGLDYHVSLLLLPFSMATISNFGLSCFPARSGMEFFLITVPGGSDAGGSGMLAFTKYAQRQSVKSRGRQDSHSKELRGSWLGSSVEIKESWLRTEKGLPQVGKSSGMVTSCDWLAARRKSSEVLGYELEMACCA